ncbi:G-type lectin S-receptor-like serine/threonine-protein kinase At2g19130 [Ricinus communis]|uniref:Receptor-like serine/threonine-protein kinase n=1 Tax=Ricinus communis TaxID=3988 RepID=B9STG0_RICCO|nr:G-type lectin S-receptor-like serine/threonine-protein kinase At2g19130 [Ricinus communis]EEF33111.1 s-receptor kinase, putative [Ricinus communis]|eukprot:XP_002529279.1 G-type lectin S-receptor-like serine/threonine-protein kinase At2g19130 [Ricinus communis]
MDSNNNPWFTLSILYLCLRLMSYLSHGADRISAKQPLSGNQTIVSASGIFVMGFFRPGNSQNYYVGIWYSVSKETIVWVVNRENPVTDMNASELRISDGNLVLFNEFKIPVWSTNLSSSTSSSSIEAVLRDEGNLVLTDGSNLLESLWQSFDHPTDTILPGAKLGLNKNTGERAHLNSWKNREDPAPGSFSFILDPNGTSQFVVLNNSKRYWATGPWNGEMFIFAPEMRINYIFNVTYVDNDNESYFSFSVYNSPIMARIVMDVGGQLLLHSWLEPAKIWSLFWYRPKLQCEAYGYCGAFGVCTETPKSSCNCLVGFEPRLAHEWNLENYSNGCQRNTSLQCGNSSSANGNSDTFLENHYQVVPDVPKIVPVESAQRCESICSENCSCTAYAYGNNACSIWFGDLLNLQIPVIENGGHTMYIRLASSNISKAYKNKGKLVGYVTGLLVALIVVVIVLFITFRRNKANKIRKAEEGLLVVFSYKDLQNATKNFSEKLGEGSFGSVFKGKLHDSSVVAVKKLGSVSQGDKQFRMEISTTGTIQHTNLVRLRGFCSEGTKKLLVYDYMPNGSLDSFLFQGNKLIVLDWKTRYNIALGTAKGLAYLHDKCKDCIIHCDIKPENILLDGEFGPKVTDFGMAKLFARDFSRVLTTMRGTIGYLAPEWISGEAITAKADVYSYGMMLFELVSGRRNTEKSYDTKTEYFPLRVANLINKDGDVLSLLDPRLEGNSIVEELTRVCKVACWCIQENEIQRPSMSRVTYFLEGVLDMELPPIPRLLQYLSWNSGVVSS